MKLKVLVKFQDINNKAIYDVEDVIDVPSDERAKSLIRRGLCEESNDEKAKTIAINEVDYDINSVKEALKSIEKGVPGNAGEKAVNSKISELTDEELQAVIEFLQK